MMRMLVTRMIPQKGLDILSDENEIEVWEGEGPIPRETLLEKVKGKDALLCLLSDRIDAEVMDAGEELKVIANYAVGFDNIDVDEATRRGIPVINTPGVLTDATADLAFALLLSSARRIPEGDRYIREGRFISWGPRLMLGKDLSEKTLGVIGAGKIGGAVMRRAKGFGMEILYNSRTRKDEIEKELGASFMEKEELIKKADFISLNCPLTEETHHMIGEKELSMMKGDAVLINTSRGPVVDEKALYRALKEGTIGAAGLDVFEKEPQVYGPLMELDNVIMVPHVGSATTRTRDKMADLACRGILEILQGKKPDNVVNGEVFQRRDLD